MNAVTVVVGCCFWIPRMILISVQQSNMKNNTPSITTARKVKPIMAPILTAPKETGLQACELPNICTSNRETGSYI